MTQDLVPRESLAGAPLDPGQAERLAAAFKALADPIRLRLLSIVLSHPDGEACVCDLTSAFDLSQPTVSHHLKILHQSGLLARRRHGTWAYYRAVPQVIATLADVLTIPVDTD